MHGLLARSAALGLVGLLCVASACGSDDSGGTDDGLEESTTEDGSSSGGQTIRHSVDIAQIWQARCTAACHEPGGAYPFVLLTSDEAYASIVGVSGPQTDGDAPTNLIEPGQPDRSYLFLKITGRQGEVEGGSGAQMPLNQDPLPPEQIDLVERWIEEGANP